MAALIDKKPIVRTFSDKNVAAAKYLSHSVAIKSRSNGANMVRLVNIGVTNRIL